MSRRAGKKREFAGDISRDSYNSHYRHLFTRYSHLFYRYSYLFAWLFTFSEVEQIIFFADVLEADLEQLLDLF